MHTVTELETSVPAFLGKLWKLVEDPETDDLICWAPNGRSFFIRNPAQFARELLPHYYKHNNMASFVRQLNMYGFHKKVSVELGGLKCDRDEMEFAHQYFVKGHPYLLDHIKRKIANKSHDAQPPIKPEVMNKVLSEVRSMRGRQEHLDTRLGAMKRENEALWRELAMLRRKHLKQQEIVNKLIHFLVTLVQPQRGTGLSVKRRYPLMIDDHQRNKHAKLSKPEASPTGPVIHELDGEHEHDQDLDSQYIVAEMLENHQNPAIQSPASIEAVLDDDNTETIYSAENAAVDEEIRILEAQEAAAKKKISCLKQKKKRKNKMPVKILIPSSEIGEEPREETLLLDVNPEETVIPIALLENKVKQKPVVPLKTVRSSKLAAMAANINKLNESEGMDDSDEVDEESRDVNNDANLDDMLLISEALNANKLANKNLAKIKVENSPKVACQQQPQQGQSQQVQPENDNQANAGSSEKTKDLSLSRVNPSGISDATYREEMDNHLETMQSELDNLRDLLRGEGYSIDANTLLGLFGGDDPMSFGIPMNPELDPTHRDKDEDDHMNDATNGSSTGGELMAYNPASGLLDFDDDIFLGAGNSMQVGSTSSANPNTPGSYYNPDPLDLEDSRGALLDSLVAENEANASAST